ncbi:MAG TPA: aspartate ammonia-lyase [Acidobacteriota bacterium]|nr:aspartate ammonia-lyase [Acidobacteriota bacterium]
MTIKPIEPQRVEKDSLGRKSVPASAYFGIETQRAVENFPISGLRASAALVEAGARIKKAAALTNARLGLLEPRTAAAIASACDEIAAGKLAGEFVVDVFQMGAGTSFHMNMNEVVANRAEELLGGRKGEYRLVHPHDHVNMAQSTNDVFPTAMRLAALALLRDKLFPALIGLESSLGRKAREFGPVLKSGRTHLQDAVPIRLGREFAAYKAAVVKSRAALAFAARSLHEIGLGGSAVGTGLNTHPRFAGLVVERLAAETGLPLGLSADPVEAMQSLRPFAGLSASVRNLALELNRIANDLRLLASGPRTGLAEISLPPVAAGSSIMPGKTNPSMLEMLNQVCYQVMGCDLAVSAGVQAGQLELNVMMPVVSFNLLFMIEILANAVRQVSARAIDGISADRERCRSYARASAGLATALSPLIGYAAAADVARESVRTGKPVAAIVRERRLLDEATLERVLDPRAMTGPGVPDLRTTRRSKPRGRVRIRTRSGG